MPVWIHKVFAASSKFGRFKNSNGRGPRAYGLVWVDKRLRGQQRYIATTLSKDYGSAGMGEDEFKFLEEDPSTSLGVKIYEEGTQVFERFLEDTRIPEAPYNGDE